MTELTVILFCICLIGLLSLVGSCFIFSTIPKTYWSAFPVGILAGVGAGISALIVTLIIKYNIDPRVIPVVLIVAIVFWISTKPRNKTTSIGPAGAYFRQSFIIDILSGILTILMLLPTLRYGFSYWTYGMADFPNYSASASAYLSHLGMTRNPLDDWGIYGQLQQFRSELHKPGLSALHAIISFFSGLEPTTLITPLMFAALFIFYSSILKACTHSFRIRVYDCFLVLAVTSFSSVVVYRFYSAQPGHIWAIALTACVVGLLSDRSLDSKSSQELKYILLVSVTGVACLLMNLTLVMGCMAPILCSYYYLSSRDTRASYKRLILFLCFVVVLFIPFLRGSLEIFQLQSSGTIGADHPLASPLALLGLQLSAKSSASTLTTLWAWLIAISLFSLLFYQAASKRGLHSEIRLMALSIAFIGINGVFIGLRAGWVSYSFAKWTAFLISYFFPIFSCFILSLFPVQDIKRLRFIFFGMATIGIFNAYTQYWELKAVNPMSFRLLRENPIIRESHSLNINVGDRRKGHILAQSFQNKDITLLDHPATSAIPYGNHFLVSPETLDNRKWDELYRINDEYLLGYHEAPTSPSTLEAAEVTFSDLSEDGKDYLAFGWDPPTSTGTPATRTQAFLVFDIPADSIFCSEGQRATLRIRFLTQKNNTSTVSIYSGSKKVFTGRLEGSADPTFPIWPTNKIASECSLRGKRIHLAIRSSSRFEIERIRFSIQSEH